MSEDDFMDIINNSGLGNLQAESELFNLSINDMIRGLRSLAECSMIMHDFIDTYITKEDDEEEDDEGPEMPIEAVMYAKQLFEIADKFTYSILSEEYDEDDDDEDVVIFLDEDEDGIDDDDTGFSGS